MTIYLAGPINGCTDAEAKDWRAEATRYLCGDEVVDPMSRDYRGKEAEAVDDIVHGDKADIDRCQGVIVYFEKPSVGTSMEVLYAWERGIPVVVVNRSGKPLSPWLVYHSVARTKTIKQAVVKVRSVRWPIKRVNQYTYQFQSNCLVNGEPIDYTLVIEKDGEIIMVEDLKETVKAAEKRFSKFRPKSGTLHEGLADKLHKAFDGRQMLTANHHGVSIVTVRQ